MEKNTGSTLTNLIIFIISMFLILSTASCELTEFFDMFTNQGNNEENNDNNNNDTTPPVTENNSEHCDTNICPEFSGIILGDTVPLDITGVDPKASNIKWSVKNGPGGGTWSPSGRDQIIENFTPDSPGTYEMEVRYDLYGGDFTCICDFTIHVKDNNLAESCDDNICPDFSSISLGDTAPLDITGVDPRASHIKWSIINGPGGGTWNPSSQDQVIEKFTPNKPGMYNLAVSYDLYGGDYTCDCEFKLEVIDKPVVIVPLTIKWSTTQKGIINEGGWKIKDNGRKIRFDVEDSLNCGGENNKVQSGSATATITVGENYTFIPEIVGIAELQDSGYESMEVKLNGKTTVSATSKGGNKECKMGPVLMNVITPPPYILTPGTHKFELDFTTNDNKYHDGSYYEVILKFQTR